MRKTGVKSENYSQIIAKKKQNILHYKSSKDSWKKRKINDYMPCFGSNLNGLSAKNSEIYSLFLMLKK